MDLRDFFIKDKRVIKTGLNLAQGLPRWIGYGLARMIGKTIARSKPAVYWQVRENLSHVMGVSVNDPSLDDLTRTAFINAGHYYYDYYHHVLKTAKKIHEMVHIPDEFVDLVHQFQSQGRGVQIIGMHVSNFDLGAIAVAATGLEIQALSTANIEQGYQFQNELRERWGFDVTPISPPALRKAIENLKQGKIVTTALDWPQPNDDFKIDVFGKPAYVPLGPARLGLMTDAVTIMVSFYNKGKHTYGMNFSEPIEMVRTGQKQNDIFTNTELMVTYMESQIRQRPEQWMMFHKLWPE